MLERAIAHQCNCWDEPQCGAGRYGRRRCGGWCCPPRRISRVLFRNSAWRGQSRAFGIAITHMQPFGGKCRRRLRTSDGSLCLAPSAYCEAPRWPASLPAWQSRSAVVCLHVELTPRPRTSGSQDAVRGWPSKSPVPPAVPTPTAHRASAIQSSAGGLDLQRPCKSRLDVRKFQHRH